jgi:hypothetical protein
MISNEIYICMELFLFGLNMLSDSILQGSTAENSSFQYWCRKRLQMTPSMDLQWIMKGDIMG